MWVERDKMFALLDSAKTGSELFPAPCPICGAQQGHILIDRDRADADRGTVWLWCPSCQSYVHASIGVPAWWKNPDFVDKEKLDSFPVYPDSLRDEIDRWVNDLMAK